MLFRSPGVESDNAAARAEGDRPLRWAVGADRQVSRAQLLQGGLHGERRFQGMPIRMSWTRRLRSGVSHFCDLHEPREGNRANRLGAVQRLRSVCSDVPSRSHRAHPKRHAPVPGLQLLNPKTHTGKGGLTGWMHPLQAVRQGVARRRSDLERGKALALF